MPERWLDRVDMLVVAPRLGLKIGRGNRVHCLSPGHDDKHPSMLVFQDGAHCFACGAHMGRIDLAMAAGNLSRDDAVAMLKKEAGIAAKENTARTLWTVDSLADITIGGKQWRLVRTWEYRSRKGIVMGGVARYESDDGKKQYFPWRPMADGRFAMKRVPPPLPLFNLDRLDEAEIVIVVEGEKAAERTQKVFDAAKGPKKIIVTCWMGGAKAASVTDWSPLNEKRVFVWPDNDVPGELVADDIFLLISERVKSVKRVRLDPKWPAKCDLYDLIEEQGWGAKQIVDHLLKHSDKEVGRPVSAETEVDDPLADNSYFKVLGYSYEGKGGNHVLIYEKETSTLHTIGKSMSADDCLQVATNRDFWHRHFMAGTEGNVFGAPTLLRIHERLLTIAKQIGWFDKARLKGRGWHWVHENDHRVAVLNTGSHLVVDGTDHPLSDAPEKESVWLRKQAINWGKSKTDPDETINGMAWQVFKHQMWDTPEMAYAVAGWATLAPICGLLDFRPGLWLRGEPGMGKSFLSGFIRRLLGPTLRLTHGRTTEAGLRRTLYSDTVAFLIDEQEAENRSEAINVEATLKLMRSTASGEGAEILMADTSKPGGVTEGVLKTMMAFISVGQQKRSEANDSRIFSALVSRPRGMNQIEFSRHALDVISPSMEFVRQRAHPDADFLRWLRAHLTDVLQSVEIGRNALIKHKGDFRFADQHGTLLGAGLFLRDGAVPDAEEVVEISDHLISGQKASRDADYVQLIHRLMEFRVDLPSPDKDSETPAVKQATLMGLVLRATEEEVDGLPIDSDIAQKILANHGVLAGRSRRVNGVVHDNRRMFLATEHHSLSTALRGSRWEGADYGAILSRTIGEKRDTRLRFADRKAYAVQIMLEDIPMFLGGDHEKTEETLSDDTDIPFPSD